MYEQVLISMFLCFAGKAKGPHFAFPGYLKAVKSMLRQLFKGTRVPIE
jgi:hypothetical protein